jgi:hypothetical protein
MVKRALLTRGPYPLRVGIAYQSIPIDFAALDG